MKYSNLKKLVMAIVLTGILTGCATTTPPTRCDEDFTPINADTVKL
jgi:outer membrane PBP1 activator LpoA protein